MNPQKMFTIILLLCLSSCVMIVKWKYGITNPKEETTEKLISFLEKHKYPTSEMYIFSDSSSYFKTVRNREFRKNMLSHLVFDHSGLLLWRDTSKCQWSGYDLIKTLSKDSSYKKDTGLNLDQILGHICPFGKSAEKDSIVNNPDFTVIVTWAKFLGEYNYRLFVLSGAVKENKAASIRLIWLNVDMQENWHLTKQQKLAFK